MNVCKKKSGSVLFFLCLNRQIQPVFVNEEKTRSQAASASISHAKTAD
jgi:hypothetical protein